MRYQYFLHLTWSVVELVMRFPSLLVSHVSIGFLKVSVRTLHRTNQLCVVCGPVVLVVFIDL